MDRVPFVRYFEQQNSETTLNGILINTTDMMELFVIKFSLVETPVYLLLLYYRESRTLVSRYCIVSLCPNQSFVLIVSIPSIHLWFLSFSPPFFLDPHPLHGTSRITVRHSCHRCVTNGNLFALGLMLFFILYTCLTLFCVIRYL